MAKKNGKSKRSLSSGKKKSEPLVTKLRLVESKNGENVIAAFNGAVPKGRIEYTVEDGDEEIVVRGDSKSCSYENVRRKRLRDVASAGGGGGGGEGVL